MKAVKGVSGLQGYVGIDLILGAAPDGAGDSVIEINPRVTTSYIGLRHLCRDNLAEKMLRVAKGEEVSPPSWHAGPLRFDADGNVSWG
jgi:predicted ATP-grasp superfamily ATP-dependent carboligase